MGLLFVAFACLSTASAHAVEVRVVEVGQTREYRVALDELLLPGERFRTMEVPKASSVAELRQRARGRTAAVSEARLVLYPADGPRTEASRRVATGEVAVWLTPDADTEALLTATGAWAAEALPGLAGWHVFTVANPDDSLELAARLASQPSVRDVQPLLGRLHARKLLPNDPEFWRLWHLRNTGLNQGIAGVDINVFEVWDAWRGAGVVIGVVDDGIQGTHPDLAPNFSAALSTNLNENDFSTFYDDHGTRVAGTAAARGNNGIGVTGAAFEATLASIRLLGDYVSDAADALAMLHRNDAIQVKNNSWGAWDSNGSLPSELAGPGPLMLAALEVGTASGRDGRGTIYVFSGGNGRAAGENVNNDGFANNVNVIAVGAVNDQGEPAIYSEPGACLVVVAPSGSGAEICRGGRQRIITTDLVGEDGRNWFLAFCETQNRDYTQNFTGTSAAAPLVSGVVALMLQANPLLGWRDVKEILLRSATRVQPEHPEWTTNSAGIAHNPNFGAGLVNARAALQLATNWVNLGHLLSLTDTRTHLALPVPDNDPVGITQTFVVDRAGFRVEQARLTLWLPHQRYGDLRVTLTSPSGITSVLTDVHHTAGAGYQGWSFSSVRHWGEDAAGVWTLTVADVRGGLTGTLDAARLELFGTGLQINGAVELENFTGPIIGGVPQGATRPVTFVATSNYFNGVVTVTNVLAHWTTDLAFNGAGIAAYTLVAVPPETMFLSAKAPMNLRKKLPVAFTNGAAVVEFIRRSPPGHGWTPALDGYLRGADFNGDNMIQFYDFAILNANWGTTNPAGDATGDGQVNDADYELLKFNWGTAGDPQ